MPLTQQLTYTGNVLTPFIEGPLAVNVSRRFQASQTLLKGQPLGLVTTGVSHSQNVVLTGTPTGGTFRLQYGGFKTAPIAHNATPAVVAAAIAALVSVGTGNASGNGSNLPAGPAIITFTGTLANQPIELMTAPAEDNLLTGGTNPGITVTTSTQGVVAGGLKAWVGDLIAAPAAPVVSAQAGGTVFGDGTNTMPYVVTLTYYNESGETTPGPAATVMVTNANRTIRVNSLTGLSTNIQGVRYYVNGVLAGTTLNASGTVAQTDLTAFTAGGGNPPSVNGCFNTRDGSHQLIGFAAYDTYTDAEGNITLGRVSTGMDQGQEVKEAPVYIEGFYRVGDLVLTSANGPQISRFGRFITGAWNDSEGLFRL